MNKIIGITIIIIVVVTSMFLIIDASLDNKESNIPSVECAKSVLCENNCLNNYDNLDDKDHSLECSYKCLTLKNC